LDHGSRITRVMSSYVIVSPSGGRDAQQRTAHHGWQPQASQPTCVTPLSCFSRKILWACQAATCCHRHAVTPKNAEFTRNRLILKVGLTNSQASTLYQDCSLTSVRSQNDLKVPRKLINIMNISIRTENRISKSVYSD